MHVRELVELGALVAAHGSKSVIYSQPLTERNLGQYWLASRCRHDRWFQAINSFDRATLLLKQEQWPYMQGIMEEVFKECHVDSEVPSRHA